MELFIALKTAELLTLASILLGGGFIGAIIAIYKAKPERDSVVVTSAQNAAQILQGLNTALYEELKRTREDRDKWEQRSDQLEALLRANNIKLPPYIQRDLPNGRSAT